MSGAGQTATGSDIAERALNLAAASPDGAGELMTMAAGCRPPLEDARKLLGGRLLLRSDDFGATKALCTVSAALSRVGWEIPHGPGDDRRAVPWPGSGQR
jgi:hypothetical protein